MKRTCRFYKEISGNWYIDLPEWEGDKSALQMVYGADTLLDIMSENGNNVNVMFSDEPFEGSHVMMWFAEGVMGDPSFGGGSYRMHQYGGVEYALDLWLCDVTKFVFGSMPDLIHFNLAD
jgi:hypothetical protein